MLLRKWPWCYGWSASPTLKSTFVEARAVLLKAGANRYLDEVMKVGGTEECWEKQCKEESKRRGSRKSPFSKRFPAEPQPIQECSGWKDKKLFWQLLNSRVVTEFHNEAGCNFHSQHGKVPANTTGGTIPVARRQGTAHSCKKRVSATVKMRLIKPQLHQNILFLGQK